MTKQIPVKVISVNGGNINLASLCEQVPTAGVGGILKYSDGEDKRELKQNDLYWLFIGFCLPYLKKDDPTLSLEELHNVWKMKFMSKVIIVKVNRKWTARKTTGSTTKLSICEFANYFSMCIEDAGTMGIPTDLFLQRYENYKKHWGI